MVFLFAVELVLCAVFRVRGNVTVHCVEEVPPFDKEELARQIQVGGGTVLQEFDLPTVSLTFAVSICF